MVISVNIRGGGGFPQGELDLFSKYLKLDIKYLFLDWKRFFKLSILSYSLNNLYFPYET